jgi:class 3 adenylate cyclase
MAGLVKAFDEPDEMLSLPLLEGRVVTLGEVYVARIVHQPGWRWSEHVKPVVGTPTCEHHHQGILLAGEFEFVMDDGVRRRVRAGEAYDVPPGHDGMVVGDEPAIAIEFAGVRGWGKPPDTGERVLATLVVTDIVGSTARAAELGDTRWKELLGRHGDRVRLELDRFRGFEVVTTGDGFVAMFDGPTRAVRCAAALTQAAERDDLQIRVGVHTGEVERQAGNLRGIALHAVSRIAALAGPGEVLLSSAAAMLLEGSDLGVEDAGAYELRGLSGRRRLYRLSPVGSETVGRAEP